VLAHVPRQLGSWLTSNVRQTNEGLSYRTSADAYVRFTLGLAKEMNAVAEDREFTPSLSRANLAIQLVRVVDAFSGR
jgi:hypothetical protein